MQSSFSFPGLTLLITVYNRSRSLERLLAAFAQLGCQFEDIVVADDASKPEHIDHMTGLQQVYNFRLLTSPQNGGLGRNLNKGQDAVTTPYTLYVQEDFVPSAAFPASLQDALQFMEDDKALDYVRFWAFLNPYPMLKPYGKGYSEMKYSVWNTDHLKFYQYSDTVHLRRSSFFDKFGRYKEGIKGDLTDYAMAISFLQHKGKGLFYDEYTKLFEHMNDDEEPSTMRELTNWRQRQNIFIRTLRLIWLKYKWLKCTWDVKFMR